MTTPRRPRVTGVIKLGGSLFELDDWPVRLLTWLAADGRSSASPPPRRQCVEAGMAQTHDPQFWLLVAGGGPWVDTLRQWDSRQSLGDESCHRWCAQLLTITADVARRRLSTAADAFPASGPDNAISVMPWVVSVADIEMPSQGSSIHAAFTRNSPASLGVVDAGAYLEIASRRGRRRLPRDWTVSSDSLAAHLASRLRARRLVLAKSCPLPSLVMTRTQAAQTGLVDSFFPQAAPSQVSVQWLNLRAQEPTAVFLAPDSK